MKTVQDVKRPSSLWVKTAVRAKLEGMKRFGESYSDLLDRLADEVTVYRGLVGRLLTEAEWVEEQAELVRMNRVTPE